MVFWSGHGVDETAGSKRLGIAFGVRTIDRAAGGTCPGDPSHTGVCGYGCVGYAIVGYAIVGYVTVGYVFTDSRLRSVLESRRLNFRYCV